MFFAYCLEVNPFCIVTQECFDQAEEQKFKDVVASHAYHRI